MNPSGYPVPADTARAESVILGSRFIATLARAPSAEDARAFIDGIRAEFPDATHNCWAYVAGPPGSTSSIGLSDAGEPHGSAGRPMLDVLLHSGVGEIAAVVTRYYGGTKLGRGGLVRAYGGAVQQALAALPTFLRVERMRVGMVVGYADVTVARRLIDDHVAELVQEDFTDMVSYILDVPVNGFEEFQLAVANATAGRARVEPL